jgi:hypothetical protein
MRLLGFIPRGLRALFEPAVTPLGLNNELGRMVSDNMDLNTAITFHQDNWKFKNRLPHDHETAHILLGLSLMCEDNMLSGQEYQGTNQSELYALSIQGLVRLAAHGGTYEMYLSDAESRVSFKEFLTRVYFNYEHYKLPETYAATLAAVACRSSALTPFELRHLVDQGKYTLGEYAKLKGIVFQPPYFETPWLVRTREGEEFTPDHLPAEDNGFIPLMKPDEQSVRRHYERILFAVDHIMDRAHDYFTSRKLENMEVRGSWNGVYASVHTGDLFDIMKKADPTQVPALEQKIINRSLHGYDGQGLSYIITGYEVHSPRAEIG